MHSDIGSDCPADAWLKSQTSGREGDSAGGVGNVGGSEVNAAGAGVGIVRCMTVDYPAVGGVWGKSGVTETGTIVCTAKAGKRGAESIRPPGAGEHVAGSLTVCSPPEIEVCPSRGIVHAPGKIGRQIRARPNWSNGRIGVSRTASGRVPAGVQTRPVATGRTGSAGVGGGHPVAAGTNAQIPAGVVAAAAKGGTSHIFMARNVA